VITAARRPGADANFNIHLKWPKLVTYDWREVGAKNISYLSLGKPRNRHVPC